MTSERFKAARKAPEGVLHSTDLMYSPFFTRTTGNNVYIKPENMQVTGAYKIRGAYFKCSTLTSEEKAKGLSAGLTGSVIRLKRNRFFNINRSSGVELKVTPEAFGLSHKAELTARLAGEGCAVHEVLPSNLYN